MSARLPRTLPRLLLAVAMVPAASLRGGEPEHAEYAVRWDPAAGGPASVRELLAFLGAPEADARSYEVRYFDFPRPASAPPDTTAILRQRTRGKGKADFRLKYRSDRPLSAPWACPDGARFKKSEEVDVSFSAAGETTRVYAYSCSFTGAVPAVLGATPKPCAAQMVRYEHEGEKIEEWTLPDGGIRLEVSRSGSSQPEHAAKFAALVDRLKASGVRPVDESKTELGSRCPEAKGAQPGS